MQSDLFSFTPFGFIANQGSNDDSLPDAILQWKQSELSETEALREDEQHSTDEIVHAMHLFRSHQQHLLNEQIQILEVQQPLKYRLIQPLGESEFQSPSLERMEMVGSDIIECENRLPPVKLSSSSSFELLQIYRSGLQKLKCGKVINSCRDTPSGYKDTSVLDIMRIAGSRYIESSLEGNENFLTIRPRDLSPFTTSHAGNFLAKLEVGDVDLTQFLIAAAEKVSLRQFDLAKKFLLRCQLVSPTIDNPIHRVIFSFAEALLEKIEKETRCTTFLGSRSSEVKELLLTFNPELLATYHKFIPPNQVTQFAGIQTILDHVASKSKIHVIDLDVGCGVRWTVFMQALAERKQKHVKILKITTIALNGKTRAPEEIGERLLNVAESLNIPFSFKVLRLREMTELEQNQFGIEKGETVVAYSVYALRTMIPKPVWLEHLMGVIKTLRPVIMIVHETEVNLNSTTFGNRFTEALFFYSAYFDMFDICFKQNKEIRVAFEAIMYASIRDVVALDDSERTVRDVKIDVWRAFFARYRMVEVGFTQSSLYQASLVGRSFSYGDFCTIDECGRSLLVGWKGTPFISLSAWKFR